MHFKRPNTATIIAFIALFAALGGTGYAAAKITSSDIKNGTIKTADISSSAKRALKGNRGPAGPQGPTGAQGPAGPSVVGKIAYVERTFEVPGGVIDIQGVQCPAGHSIVSGGWTLISADAVAFVDRSYSGAEWSVGVDNFFGTLAAQATAHAWCAPTGAAVVATAGNASVRGQRAADEQRQRQAH